VTALFIDSALDTQIRTDGGSLGAVLPQNVRYDCMFSLVVLHAVHGRNMSSFVEFLSSPGTLLPANRSLFYDADIVR